MPIWKGPVDLPQYGAAEVPQREHFNRAFENINRWFGIAEINGDIRDAAEAAAESAEKSSLRAQAAVHDAEKAVHDASLEADRAEAAADVASAQGNRSEAEADRAQAYADAMTKPPAKNVYNFILQDDKTGKTYKLSVSNGALNVLELAQEIAPTEHTLLDDKTGKAYKVAVAGGIIGLEEI